MMAEFDCASQERIEVGIRVAIGTLKSYPEAEPFRRFYLTAGMATYRIDRPDQVVVREDSIQVTIFGMPDVVPIDSIRALKFA